MAKKTTIVKKQETNIAVVNKALEGDWSTFEGDVADILIPKLLIGQAMSQAVQDEKVKFGEIFKSTDIAPLGGRGEPVGFIPLTHNKTWIMFEKVQGKYEFRGIEEHNASNSDSPWSFQKDGSEWKREKALNFYGLIPGDITSDIAARESFAKTGDLPDTDDSLLPVVIQFKSTSYKHGKTLISHFARAADFQVPPFVNFFHISTDKESNDKGTYYVYTAAKAGKTEKNQLAACKRWWSTVKKTHVKVDHSDLDTKTEKVVTMEGGEF